MTSKGFSGAATLAMGGVEKLRGERTAGLAGADRVQLNRLIWDVCSSEFGCRQELYKRFFAGTPERLASAYFTLYGKEPLRERVRKLLWHG